MKENVYVEILGKKYIVNSDVSFSRIDALAKYVEECLGDARANAETQSTSEIAVLASLNIADKLFCLKEEYEKLKTQVVKLRREKK